MVQSESATASATPASNVYSCPVLKSILKSKSTDEPKANDPETTDLTAEDIPQAGTSKEASKLKVVDDFSDDDMKVIASFSAKSPAKTYATGHQRRNWLQR